MINKMESEILKNELVEIRNLDSTKSLLLIVEHAGNLIPSYMNELGLSAADRKRHISYDIGIREVADYLVTSIDLTSILSRYSRLVVDLNRTANSRECVIEKSDGTDILGNIGLTSDARASRIAKYHTPFHQTIKSIISKKNPTAILSLHSFTPKLETEQTIRPFSCGVLYHNNYSSLGQDCIRFLRASKSYIVGDNQPYHIREKKDYTIPEYGNQHRIPAVLIEIRQDLITHEYGQKKWAKIMVSMIKECLSEHL